MNRFLSVFDPAKPAIEVLGLPRTLEGLYGRTAKSFDNIRKRTLVDFEFHLGHEYEAI